RDVVALLAEDARHAVGVVEPQRPRARRRQRELLDDLDPLAPGDARQQRAQEAAEAAPLEAVVARTLVLVHVLVGVRVPAGLVPARPHDASGVASAVTCSSSRVSSGPPGPRSESVATAVSSLSSGFTSITTPPARSTS